MPIVQQFAYGPVNPIMAVAFAFVGSLVGLSCTVRARRATIRRRRIRWLILASMAIGGVAIWLMHFMAMLGFDVPDSPVRYSPGITAASLVIVLAVVVAGLGVVSFGRRTPLRLIAGGIITGSGVAAMHYTGMAAVHIDGHFSYDGPLVAASVLIAILAATVALWFAVTIDGWWPIMTAAGVMAVAVCGMHYTGMAAVRVHLRPAGEPVSGVMPASILLPIALLAMVALVLPAFSALGAMDDDDLPMRVDPEVLRGTGARVGGGPPTTPAPVVRPVRVPTQSVPSRDDAPRRHRGE